MEMEDIDGQMEGNTVVIGSAIRCMAKGYLHGLMAENMKGNITMIKNKVMEFSLGQMVGNTMVTG